MDRRAFIKRTTVMGAGLAAAQLAGLPVSAQGADMPRRPLGKTGWETSIHGLGTLHYPEDGHQAVFERSMELGVNLVDTAYVYHNGNVERRLGELVPTYRDRIFLVTKWYHNPRDTMVAWLDESLQRMKVDYVDCIMLHRADSAEMVNDPQVHEAFAQVKEAGKARFTGVSMHTNMAAVMDAAVAHGGYDIVLIRNGPAANQQANLDPVIERTRQAGLGIIAMKSQDGRQWDRPFPGSDAMVAEGLNMHQARVKWVLQNPNVDVLITDTTTVEMVEENCAAAGCALTPDENEAMRRYLRFCQSNVCGWCGTCTLNCPQRIAIHDIMRYRSYAVGYDDLFLAREHYARLPRDRTAAACTHCGTCQAVCPKGLPVMERLQEAGRLLG